MTYINIFLNDLTQQSLKMHVMMWCLFFFMFWFLCTNFGLVWILLFVKASVMSSLAIVLLDWKRQVFCSFP